MQLKSPSAILSPALKDVAIANNPRYANFGQGIYRARERSYLYLWYSRQVGFARAGR